MKRKACAHHQHSLWLSVYLSLIRIEFDAIYVEVGHGRWAIGGRWPVVPGWEWPCMVRSYPHKINILFCLAAIFDAILRHYTFMGDRYSRGETTPHPLTLPHSLFPSCHRLSSGQPVLRSLSNLAWPHCCTAVGGRISWCKPTIGQIERMKKATRISSIRFLRLFSHCQIKALEGVLWRAYLILMPVLHFSFHSILPNQALFPSSTRSLPLEYSTQTHEPPST